jgi:hypothetical protein
MRGSGKELRIFEKEVSEKIKIVGIATCFQTSSFRRTAKIGKRSYVERIILEIKQSTRKFRRFMTSHVTSESDHVS